MKDRQGETATKRKIVVASDSVGVASGFYNRCVLLFQGKSASRNLADDQPG